MDTSRLKKFAQYARRSLIEQVQSKLKLVLAEDSAARREHPQAVKELEAKQKEFGDDQQLIEQVAYTWFNRFCALRFMDANQYNRIMVVSPIVGQFQPEILAEAKAGHLDESVFDAKTSDKVQGLLSGSVPSRDGQAEAYRLIIVAICNAYHRLMPYLFERIEDYTELLMPEDLLSGNSILAYTREAMTPENCESVESIGWLYQFYISEKKDQVFEGLKKNKKITPENIPAATQLFTPHWIVKYLVENSLGRLWMLNNPSSKVIEQMKYYIKPVGEETDFLKISTPEELKICDPAAGSGHMLTYAYDLLYAIYLDANYDPVDIPELILTKNLYGIEIDERAAELAAFALSMKAMKGNPFDDSNNRRRFFRKPIEPNICRLEKVKIDDAALEEYIEFAGKELFTDDVRATLKEFEEADNFGSLIQPTLKDQTELLEILESKGAQVDLFSKDTHESILKILKQAKYLSHIYHVVIANPPYMGNGGMNKVLNNWVKDNYPDSKSDLMTCFMERAHKLVVSKGYWAMINLPSWMFLTSYHKLRNKLVTNSNINSLLHLGRGIFGSDFGSVAFVVSKLKSTDNQNTVFRKLFEEHVQVRKSTEIEKLFLDKSYGYFRLNQKELLRIPGVPIAYWVGESFRKIFEKEPIKNKFITRLGLSTANNDRFLRNWYELSIEHIGFDKKSRDEAQKSALKWFPYEKGGAFRKWFGNHDLVVNWQNDGYEVRNFGKEEGKIRSHNYNLDYIFKSGITWSDVTSGTNAFRYMPEGFLFDGRGSSGFVKNAQDFNLIFGFLNSCVSTYAISAINPTVAVNVGEIAKLPYPELNVRDLRVVTENVTQLINIHKRDWDSNEVSWDFKKSPFLASGLKSNDLRATFNELSRKWETDTNKVVKIEEENNSIFIKSYSLEENLSASVDIKHITLNSNPYYRFSKIKSDSEKLSLLKEESIKEFLSYAIGCAFGRYSLSHDGLIIASRGIALRDISNKYSAKFSPDEDNVIPIIDFELEKDKDEYWFEDDITERFKEFLKVTFSEENFTENLAFIEEAIGKDIRKYFVKDFYADHVKRYKKRPIYWMFSSPKGSFNALIYMHRYQPDTVSIVLNDYLREFRTKLEARKESYEQVEISASASQKDKTNAIKVIAKINKVLEEINDYEHDVLYPLAGEKIEIDLDDGVKHNYPLFGKALKKVPGLS